MKIAVVASYAPSLVNFRGALLASLVDAGHTVHAFAPAENSAKTAETLRRMNVEFDAIPLERNGTDPRQDLRTMFHLVRCFRRLRPDVVFSYTVKPVIWGMLAARIARVPRRVAMVTGLGHAFIESEHRRGSVAKVVRRLYSVALRAASCVIFHNDDDRQLFLRDRLVPGDGRAVVVPGSGVDVTHFAQQPLPSSPSDSLQFLLITRLLVEKGVREFVDTARIVKSTYPNATFRLVGPMDSNPSGITQNEVDAWRAEGIVDVVGPVADVRDALAGCHVYVLPSYREGLPRTNLEAMATGRALITTDVPGCRQTVWPDNGVLVPARNAQHLATACTDLLAASRSDLDAMGAASRRHAESCFDVRNINGQMRAHITGIAEAV